MHAHSSSISVIKTVNLKDKWMNNFFPKHEMIPYCPSVRDRYFCLFKDSQSSREICKSKYYLRQTFSHM